MLDVHTAPFMENTLPRQYRLHLCSNETVEVRSREEILATLDANGCLEGMPFMPEMLRYCGKRLQVHRRAHKTCDTITSTGARRVHAAVHLEGTRCDGSAHGDCEAACNLFWKEQWLKRPDPVGPADTPPPNGCTVEQLTAATRARSATSNPLEPRYSCQATALLNATEPLSPWDPRQYIEDYLSGNVDFMTFVRGFIYRYGAAVIRRGERLGRRIGLGDKLAQRLVGVYDQLQRTIPDGVPYPRLFGSIPRDQKTPTEPTYELRPGANVRVKTYPEILATLNVDNKNRGLYFDAEHVPYCGRVLRVRSAVNRIIEEHTGRMLHFKTPSYILEGAHCQGAFSERRMFCPRAIYPYWRSIWLTPLEASEHQQPHARDEVASETGWGRAEVL